MAPQSGNLGSKVIKPLAGVRRSQRIIARNSKGSGHRATHPAAISENIGEPCVTPTLNDDCLLAIFSHVRMKDLLQNVSVCSRRFNALAIDAARRKCRTERFVYDYSDKMDASILERFGEFMQDVEVFDKNLKVSHSFKWLKHCTSLKTLTVREMTLNYDEECAETLRKLENLKLFIRDQRRSVAYNHPGIFVMACHSLKSISITERPEELCLYLEDAKCLDNLATIYLDVRHQWKKTNGISTKIRQLKSLKFLECIVRGFEDVKVVKALSASKSLEKLVVHVFLSPEYIADDLTVAMDKFKNLKSGEINYEWHSSLEGYGQVSAKFDAPNVGGTSKLFDVSPSRSSHVRNVAYVFRKYSVIYTRKN